MGWDGDGELCVWESVKEKEKEKELEKVQESKLEDEYALGWG